MSGFSRVRGWFSRSVAPKETSFNTATLEIDQVNVSDLARELEIKSNARSNGLRQVPASDQLHPDSAEMDIVHHCRSYIQNGFGKLVAVEKGQDDLVSGIQVSAKTSAITEIPAKLSANLTSLLEKSKADLAIRREDYHEADRDYEHFRRENEITRAALYPESHFKHRAGLVLIVLVAAAVNALFFGDALPTGLVGGFGLALIFGCIDVGFSFGLGRLVPRTDLPQAKHRILGGLASVIFLSWAVGWNLLLAHLRDQAQRIANSAESLGREDDMITVAGIAAWESFATNPLGISDLTSWAFAAMGLLLSILAMLDGMRWDEKIPGYSRLDKRRKEARGDYDEACAEFREATSELVDGANSELARIEQEIRNDVHAVSYAITSRQSLQKNYNRVVEYYEKICNNLIHQYRDENRVARRTEAPAFFDEEWNYPDEERHVVDTAPLEKRLAEEKRSAASLPKLRKQIAADIAKVSQEFNSRCVGVADPLNERR